MYKFEHITFLWGIALVPVCCLLYVYFCRQRKKRLAKLAELRIVQVLMPDDSKWKRNLKFSLYALALLFAILGLANLQTGSKIKEVKREGGDVVLCLDVSNSMLAEDLSPNRLERAKQAMEKFIDELNGDRIAMVVFAGEAFVQLPLTTDYGAAKLFLQGIQPGMLATQGTNISGAIDRAIECLGKDEGKKRAAVIITDGENHEEEAIAKAEEALQNGIFVHTIGIGSENGVPIPLYQNGQKAGYKKDREGQTVITKLNADLLAKIAEAGKGIFIKASNADLGLDLIMDKIKELDKETIEAKMYTDYEDQFQLFFAIAFALLVLEFILSHKVSQFWKKWSPFQSSS